VEDDVMALRFCSALSVGILMGCGATTSQAPVASASQTHACSALTDLDSQVAALYAPSAVSKVEALYHQPELYETPRFAVRAYQPSRHVEGASLYVPAPANTSPAYLERALSCHAAGAGSAAQQQYGNDPLRIEGVKDVDVRAAGAMLRIDVRAQDRASGERVLQAARSLRGTVGVTQLASASEPGSF
jgi:hypothetical protein